MVASHDHKDVNWLRKNYARYQRGRSARWNLRRTFGLTNSEVSNRRQFAR